MVSDFIRTGNITTIFCTAVPVIGWIFSIIYFLSTRKVEIDPARMSQESANLNSSLNSSQKSKVYEIYKLIYDGAHSFLYAEYRYIFVFIVFFSIALLLIISLTTTWKDGIMTTISFIVGSLTSVLSGYIGMKIGVFANARTAVKCQQSLAQGFQTSFKAAVVMGFCLCSFGIFNLFVLIKLVGLAYSDADTNSDSTQSLYEAIAGYGLGGSSIALFGRVGGGIYTKAADVGADLVGKVEQGIPEDDLRNPAVIADNVGDNVGDIAGMGADLFGSFAESSCAALVIAAQSGKISYSSSDFFDPSNAVWSNFGYITFPLVISGSGIIACLITSFFATHFCVPTKITKIEPTLKQQLLISTAIETLFMYLLSIIMFPDQVNFPGKAIQDPLHSTRVITQPITVKNWQLFFCLASGLWSGLLIGYITEYYTSNQYKPVKELANNCITGAATNIIIGLALGYKSVVIPITAMGFATYIGHSLAGFYGVALNAIGILSTLSIGLTIDAFGPICDNAGGISEMCELGEQTRERTDALDAAGNTTAAIGKGFAIGSAAFVSLALFSGYITLLQTRSDQFITVDMLSAYPFSGLLIGAMIPYWFSAMTMAAVGRAAFAMVREVRHQFASNKLILSGDAAPDYATCIEISTTASLKEMIPPGILVMGTPIVVGYLFGCQALAGVLLGSVVSGVQIAISASNTGGAWDNAKKYIEQGKLGEDHAKGSDAHSAAIVGDTVGDPLKDTSGPAINIVMKLMAVESLVLSKAFYVKQNGLFGYIGSKI